jgi:Ca2+-binding EF-hand superfamily protein
MVGILNEEEKQTLIDIFNKFDKNKKGELGNDEIRLFLYTVFDELGEDTSVLKGNALICELLDLFDKDKNGLINFKEFNKLIEFLILEKGLNIF